MIFYSLSHSQLATFLTLSTTTKICRHKELHFKKRHRKQIKAQKRRPKKMDNI